MYILKEEKITEIIEKNSKFITYSFHVNSKDNVKEKLVCLKSIHPKANHHCYAYILENEKRANDDREPKNTAGLPILNVLENNLMINTLIVVIRYFGGIELGTGGLTRAYSKSTINNIINNQTEVEKGYLVEIEVDYKKAKELNYILKDNSTTKIMYQNTLIYTFQISKDNLKQINKYNYKLIKEVYIKKG